MKKRYLWLIAAIVWGTAIFGVTGSPSSTGGNTRWIIQKILGLSSDQALWLNFIFRKLVHLGAFGLLAILIYNGLEKKRLFIAWILTTLYAASDELHQYFVPDRTASIWDIGLDSLGALLALGLIRFFNFLFRSNQSSYKES